MHRGSCNRSWAQSACGKSCWWGKIRNWRQTRACFAPETALIMWQERRFCDNFNPDLRLLTQFWLLKNPVFVFDASFSNERCPRGIFPCSCRPRWRVVKMMSSDNGPRPAPIGRRAPLIRKPANRERLSTSTPLENLLSSYDPLLLVAVV